MYLEMAELNAEYWLDHAPENGVVPWDFDAPASGPLSRAQVDTSASAIAAVGLLNLADFSVNEARRNAYRERAMKTIGTLATEYLGESVAGWEGILRGGVYHIHKNLGVNESVMWGEFFFVEALQRALRILRNPI
jgi:unsaturated chondroitin disaccharide hydrolase